MSGHDVFGLVGRVLDARYRLDSVVGEGGFGVVYRGWHLNFRQPVAIKVLKAPGHFSPEARASFVDKFREEGELLSQLSDAPGIVRVFDFGVAAETALGVAPYLVLEWLEGRTFEDFLEERRTAGAGPLPIGEAVALLAPAIDAVGYAHGRKIVHRDLKPANVFLVTTSRGLAVKVLDFGIGKAMQEGEDANFAATGTKSSFHAFSPLYGAPEQFFSKRFGATGPWTDVHALGLVLVEMLIGRHALDGDDSAELLVSATDAVRPTPRARGVTVPDPVEAVLARALALRPQERYPNASALLNALRAALGEVGAPLPGVSAYGARASLPAPEPVRASTVPDPPPGPDVSTEMFLAQRHGGATEEAELPPTERAPELAGIAPAATVAGGAVTEPRPDRPAAPLAATARGVGRRWASVALGLAVVAGGVGAAIGLSSRGGGGGAAPTSTATSSEVVPVVDPDRQEVSFAHDYAVGRDVYPVAPLEESARSGRWHVRIARRGARTVSVARVRPSGEVASELRIEHAGDGTRTLRSLDAAGVETSVQAITPDGLSTETARSGVVSSNGCYRTKLAYDAAGHVAESTCLSPTGVPITDAGGCQQRRYTWTAEHTLLTEACHGLDASGKESRPVADWGGLCLGKYRYDERGQRLSHGMFDVLGASGARLSDGCFGVAYAYDAAGNQVSETCTDATGAPRAWTGQKVARTRSEYDAHGCKVRSVYLDVADRPATSGAVASEVWKVDGACRALRHEQRGADGKLVAGPTGPQAARETEYDVKGQAVVERCFGADDKPVGCSAPSAEGAVVRTTCDERGRPVSIRYFTPDGKPSRESDDYPHETRIAYGEEGREITRAFHDEAGKLVPALGGVARFATRYDAVGGEVSYSFFDADGQPMDSGVGCHEIRRSYDDRHRLAAIECRDKTGAFKITTMVLGGVAWPPGSARMAIVRGERVENVYASPDGRELRRVDCSSLATPCFR